MVTHGAWVARVRLHAWLKRWRRRGHGNLLRLLGSTRWFRFRRCCTLLFFFFFFTLLLLFFLFL
jgi:hypothetical protein